jgi:hypothetical protein
MAKRPRLKLEVESTESEADRGQAAGIKESRGVVEDTRGITGWNQAVTRKGNKTKAEFVTADGDDGDGIIRGGGSFELFWAVVLGEEWELEAMTSIKDREDGVEATMIFEVVKLP